ncbi:hypothetical protein, partial [Bacillus oleivorans]|uniref:hypothetical protein n=1 Tax=Bacillus oleivorans TaxID=1448271 RepID=UPI00339ADA9E
LSIKVFDIALKKIELTLTLFFVQFSRNNELLLLPCDELKNHFSEYALAQEQDLYYIAHNIMCQ